MDESKSLSSKEEKVVNEPAAGIWIPSRESLEMMEVRELAETFVQNHKKLLERVEKLDPENIPYFGLHGLKMAEDLQQILETENPYLQVVTVLKKSENAISALTDLYDVVGGDMPYFIKGGLLVLDVADGDESLCDRW